MTPMKLLGYLTTDSMNAATAEVLAARYGLKLEVVEPRDLPQLECQSVDFVLDWDFIPEDSQAELLNSTAVNIVAVHGYNLSDGLAGFLPRRGIICSPRLDCRLVQALASPARAA
jgi:hypothetical protein